MEQSVYIIKPEGMQFRESIRSMIRKARLTLVSTEVFTVPKWVPMFLYPELSIAQDETWRLTCEQFVGQRCEVGIVCGERVVERLVAVCGSDKNPAKCEPRSIRRVFGFRNGVKLSNNGRFWYNVIHRSKNQQEAARDLKIIQYLRTTGS